MKNNEKPCRALRILNGCSHLLLVLGGMFLTFFIIDRVNTSMGFIDSEISKWLLCAFAVVAMVHGIACIIAYRFYARQREQQAIRLGKHDRQVFLSHVANGAEIDREASKEIDDRVADEMQEAVYLHLPDDELMPLPLNENDGEKMS